MCWCIWWWRYSLWVSLSFDHQSVFFPYNESYAWGEKNGCTLSPWKYKTQMEPEQSAPTAFPMHPHFFWAGPTVHFYTQRAHYYYLGNVLHPLGYDESIPPWTPYAFYWLGESMRNAKPASLFLSPIPFRTFPRVIFWCLWAQNVFKVL